MSDRRGLPAIAAALLVLSTCGSGRHSSSAFRLAADGDVDRGKAAFLALGCHDCHEVAGTDLPDPTVQPPVPVVLGGMVDTKFSDAYLVTSIIYPSYNLAPYPKGQITTRGQSRMPHNIDQITVRQIDRFSRVSPIALLGIAAPGGISLIAPDLLKYADREIESAEQQNGKDGDHQSLDDPFPGCNYLGIIVFDLLFETVKHRIPASLVSFHVV